MLDRGKISESLVIHQLISLGWNVSVPFSDHCVYDIISESNEGLKKVQIKTATRNPSSGNRSPKIDSSRGSTSKKYLYTKNEIDLVIGVYENVCYIHDDFDTRRKASIQTCKRLEDHPIFQRK